MLQAFAAACYRRRRTVLVVWLVAVVGATVLGRTFGGEFSESFRLPGTESQEAADLLRSRFASHAGDEGSIVFRAEAGVADPDVQARMEQVFAAVAEVPGVVAVGSPYAPGAERQVAEGGEVAFAQVLFEERAFQVPERTTDEIVGIVDDATTADLQVEAGGDMFSSHAPPGSSELIGLVAAAIILLVTFGSLLAMGLPILTALVGIGIGLAAVELLARVMAIPDFSTQLAAMIGIGVGIDYALFIVTRYRQGLHDGLDPERAVVLAIDTAGRAVLFAGITVVISILGLFLMRVEFVNGLAVATAVTVAVVMAASVTLLPAVLGFVGRNIDRLGFRRRRRAETRGRTSIWFRWSRVVQRRPWPVALGGLVVLLVLAVPALSLRMGFEDAGNQPAGSTAREAYDLLADGFGPGFNGPLVLAVEIPPGTDPAALPALAEAAADTPGVAAVTPPVTNDTGDAAVIRVVPDSAPQDDETVQLIHRLRDETIPAATAGTGVDVSVGGFTASGNDISEVLSRRLPWFIGGVLAVSFLLLLMVFRSVLVPLKAIAMNVLSIGAAYGLIVAVFQWGWLASLVGVDRTVPIVPFVPMMMFAIVFGLSMDYEVFLLSRVREEYDRTGDNGLAVADGVATTARVITAAALIMITVFGSFVLNGETILKLFGLGLAGAILIDATIVRMVLVPATMELLGDRNWWFPRWLDRIVPRMHVEAPKEVVAELETGHVPDEERPPTPVG